MSDKRQTKGVKADEKCEQPGGLRGNRLDIPPYMVS